jgi:hypothetical protein
MNDLSPRRQERKGTIFYRRGAEAQRTYLFLKPENYFFLLCVSAPLRFIYLFFHGNAAQALLRSNNQLSLRAWRLGEIKVYNDIFSGQ